MRPEFCNHKPPCPLGTTRWDCGRRTALEADVKHKRLDREAVEKFLAKRGQPITPKSKVYTGELPDPPERQQPLI